MKRHIYIEEQGPRDGLQSLAQVLPTSQKVSLIHGLADAGLARIQVASFVHPKRVPQMADAEALCAALEPRDGVLYSGLTLNQRGVERAIGAGLSHVATSLSVSNTHGVKNTGKTLEESRMAFEGMVSTARASGLRVRGGLQCVFGCRMEGAIEPAHVLEEVQRHLDAGVHELALADSTGMGHPGLVRDVVGAAVELAGEVPVFLHLHDTEGKGIANALAAIEAGARHFDTGFAGTGGCPFIPGASGNIATEDLVHVVEQMGFETGVSLAGVAQVSLKLEGLARQTFPGKMHRVLEAQQRKVA